MKLFVIDYDNTLYFNKYNLKFNIKKINKFMEKGNKFAIATTNDYSIMEREISSNKIKYDYLSLSNGLVLLDKWNDVISAKYISNSEKEEIIYAMSPYSKKEVYNYNEHSKLSNYNTTTMIFIVNHLKDISIIREVFEEYFPEFDVIATGFRVHIRKKTNKVDSVDIIKDMDDFSDSDIYTIGDNIQDLEMIKKYNGYNMLISNHNLYKESKGTVTSVRRLIKKIDKF